MQKLNARKAALRKTTAIPEKDKAMWMECLVPEVMSSEDSEDDGSFIQFALYHGEVARQHAFLLAWTLNTERNSLERVEL